jgi:hypothetical protein
LLLATRDAATGRGPTGAQLELAAWHGRVGPDFDACHPERFAHEPAGHFRDLRGFLLGQLMVCCEYAERSLEPDPPAATWVPAPVVAGAVDDERDESG